MWFHPGVCGLPSHAIDAYCNLIENSFVLTAITSIVAGMPLQERNKNNIFIVFYITQLVVKTMTERVK